MFRKICLLSLVVLAAAVAAPIAQSSSAPKVDPLAVGYLIGQGLTPSQVTSWTTGACSHAVKDASCYAMFRATATVPTPTTGSTGFQWGDAGIGAGFVLVIVILGSAAVGLLFSRQNRRNQAARA